MNKTLTLIFLTMLSGHLLASSRSTTPLNFFQDDLSRVEAEFAGITELEQLVEGCSATYSELALESNPQLSAVSNDQDILASLLSGAAPDTERALGIPGFCWGFCLGLVGILITYVSLEGDARSKQTREAWLGCIVGLGIGVLISLIAIAATGSLFYWDY
ncbi:MAG: hypothetical protein Q7T20_17705 [Saprospiraceae bacterium]|nr:hypothetical protein [Saprospiraceae bacterium]